MKHRANRSHKGVRLLILVAVAAAAVGLGWLRHWGGMGGSGPVRAADHASAPRTMSRCAVTRILMPTCGAWWGMFLPANPNGAGLVHTVSREEGLLRRPLDIIETYHDMTTTAEGRFPNRAEQELAKNHLLLFSWQTAVWAKNYRYPWQKIASGALDRSLIIPEAKRLRAFPHTVLLAFSAEPDGSVPGQGSPAQFVAAWRHVHNVFARLGVRNVVWVWTTTGYLPHQRTIAALYPGNAYVDWIGYDPYNFYLCHHHREWESFAQTVGPFYHWVVSHKFGGKPMILTEFGTARDPADPARSAAWYRGVVPEIRSLPRLKALIMWNATTGCDLSLDAAATAVYRRAGFSPYLRQPLP